MPTAECLANIAKIGPNEKYCPGNICANVQQRLDKYCHDRDKGGNVPIPQAPESGDCWCCCSCFSYFTQIAIRRDAKKNFEFKIIQDIKKGEKVIATNPGVTKWELRKVTDLGGIAPESQMVFMYYCRLLRADGAITQLVTTADHLFLRPSKSKTGLLTAIQDLRPGDKVRQSDGKEATIQIVAPGEFNGGVRHIALGEFKDGDSLDGHLINSEGIITADLSVQCANFTGKLDHLIHPVNPKEPKVGSTAYLKKYGQKDYLDFVNDPSSWPLNFTPIMMDSLINVPPSTLKYFSEEQANDIEKASGSQDIGDSASLATTRFLFTTFGAWFKNIYFIVDWKNESPNAYYFLEYQQKYVVLTGGMTRLLNRDGLSIVLTHLIAQSEGYTCTGEADYEGVLLYLRQVFDEDMFFSVYRKGLEQLTALFEMIKPEHRDENPDNICELPSIDCRIAALKAGAAMSALPDCANPTANFLLEKAEASANLSELTIDFNRNVNAVSAELTSNYMLTPGTHIVELVTLDKNDQSIVHLKLFKELQRGTSYKLSIKNVYSQQGVLIDAAHCSVNFKTK